ncbi:DNAJB8, partial [Symbiodinium sp. KB8]
MAFIPNCMRSGLVLRGPHELRTRPGLLLRLRASRACRIYVGVEASYGSERPRNGGGLAELLLSLGWTAESVKEVSAPAWGDKTSNMQMLSRRLTEGQELEMPLRGRTSAEEAPLLMLLVVAPRLRQCRGLGLSGPVLQRAARNSSAPSPHGRRRNPDFRLRHFPRYCDFFVPTDQRQSNKQWLQKLWRQPRALCAKWCQPTSSWRSCCSSGPRNGYVAHTSSSSSNSNNNSNHQAESSDPNVIQRDYFSLGLPRSAMSKTPAFEEMISQLRQVALWRELPAHELRKECQDQGVSAGGLVGGEEEQPKELLERLILANCADLWQTQGLPLKRLPTIQCAADLAKEFVRLQAADDRALLEEYKRLEIPTQAETPTKRRELLQRLQRVAAWR